MRPSSPIAADDLPADPHPAIDKRKSCPFSAVHDVEGFESRPFNRRGQRGVGRPPGDTAQRLANGGGRNCVSKQVQATWQEMPSNNAAGLRQYDFSHSLFAP